MPDQTTTVFCAALLGAALAACSQAQQQGRDKSFAELPVASAGEEIATFAGGCFWCMEAPFEKLAGVRAVVSGYAGGDEPDPTYSQVSGGRTGHTEAVQIVFDPSVVRYAQLVEVFWRSMDPTDGGGQFADRGSQYRPEIFVHDAAQRAAAEASKKALAASGRFGRPIAVPITDYTSFYPAERYHQDYYLTNTGHYQRYARGSGRVGFLQRSWADAPPLDVAKKYAKPSDDVLREKLTELQYAVTQKDDTERAFTGEYWDNKRPGIYVDIVSGEPLFSSKDKFDSGTGWPSFTRPLVDANIAKRSDRSLLYERVEVRSKHGDSHLGHVFADGPKPTGLRYCVNSAALRFVPVAKLEAEGYGKFAALFTDAAPKATSRPIAPTSRPSGRTR